MQGQAQSDDTSAGAARFPTTHWSVVLAAAQEPSPVSRSALETLCRAYWYPLYAFVRRQGYGPEDAEDLTQAFFERLLEGRYLEQVNREKGRFRSFLLTCLRHFLSDRLDWARAARRGGGQTFISLEGQSAEELYLSEQADEMSPEKLFERRWASSILDRAYQRLYEENERTGKVEFFQKLRPFDGKEQTTPKYADLAAELGTTEGAIKLKVFRLRRRYRELLREEVAQTVAAPAEIDEELRHLMKALST